MVASAEQGAGYVARRPLPSWATHPTFLYGAVPLVLAAVFTLLRAGFAALLPLGSGMLVWVLIVLPTWWGAQLATLVAHRLLRPWTPPLWFLCITGSVVQALALSPWLRAVYAWAQELAGAGLHGDYPLPEFSIRYALTLAFALAPGATLWVAFNYTCDRVLGLPRFRYGDANAKLESDATAQGASPGASPGAAPGAAQDDATSDASLPHAATDSGMPRAAAGPSAQTSATAPLPSIDTLRPPPPPVPPPVPSPLLARSRLPHDAEIRAITAEEHYVRLFTDKGRDLVRFRFSDALDGLAHVTDGVQVHRSWWVRLDRVVEWVDRDRTFELVLEDGLRVPVSVAFRSAVRQRLHARRAP